MNGESMALDGGQIIFPVKVEKEIKSELKTVEIKSVNIADARIEIKETRFARLKKSLRKRSVSIL